MATVSPFSNSKVSELAKQEEVVVVDEEEL
jgi:hypothetical protein